MEEEQLLEEVIGTCPEDCGGEAGRDEEEGGGGSNVEPGAGLVEGFEDAVSVGLPGKNDDGVVEVTIFPFEELREISGEYAVRSPVQLTEADRRC